MEAWKANEAAAGTPAKERPPTPSKTPKRRAQ